MRSRIRQSREGLARVCRAETKDEQIVPSFAPPVNALIKEFIIQVCPDSCRIMILMTPNLSSIYVYCSSTLFSKVVNCRTEPSRHLCFLYPPSTPKPSYHAQCCFFMLVFCLSLQSKG
ncbi:hypothetical protein VNO77_40201 [Canavalia gladiata]|uniref:Uncharacterized protein n=1 Tax=Canavalia gladiata TaxID=3824 RepID=A0AAN9JYL0_CANGL